jgi:hypothetical protein
MSSATKIIMSVCLSLALHLNLALVRTASAAQPQELGPRDFNLLIPVQLDAGAPVYRLQLPFEVYAKSRVSPLRDLRIFNSLGKAEAFTISTVTTRAAEMEERSRPCFMQRVAVTVGGDIMLLGEGESGRRETSPGDKARRDDIQRSTLGVLADFGTERAPFDRLRIVPEAAPHIDAMVSVSLYSSDDMRRWNRREAATLGRLNMNEQTLELFDLPVAAANGRYLLILPSADAEMFKAREILAVEKTATPLLSATLRGHWDDEAEGYLYALPRALPVTSVEARRNEKNYLLRGEMLTLAPQAPGARGSRPRPAKETAWQSRARIHSYSVTDNDIRRRGAPLHFDRAWLHPSRNDATLRQGAPTLLLRPQGNSWPGAPDLRVHWEEQQLFFVAGGPGPYVLAVGNERAESKAENSLEPEMLATAAPAALQLNEAQEQAVSGLEAASDTRWMIWGILLLGAACMAFMALQLLRKPN